MAAMYVHHISIDVFLETSIIDRIADIFVQRPLCDPVVSNLAFDGYNLESLYLVTWRKSYENDHDMYFHWKLNRIRILNMGSDLT